MNNGNHDEELRQDTEEILDAVLMALKGKSGHFAAFPSAFCAATEILFLASLLDIPEQERRPIKMAMATVLSTAADRIAKATTAQCVDARMVIRQVLGMEER